LKTNKSKTKTDKKRQQQQSLDFQAAAAPDRNIQLDAQKPGQPMSAGEFLEEYAQQQRRRPARTKAERQTEKLVETILSGSAGSVSPSQSEGPRAHRVIKLGIDVHLERYVVVRQIDGATPQPAQTFTPTQFLAWAKKQTELAAQVYSCYEAGPFGYSLHRKLAALGVTNYVVRPRDWDEYGRKVKTDKRDAKELVLNLDRYLGGNRKAFCVVRVPSEAEEQARSRSRQRESLQKEKHRLAAQGRSDALYYGGRLEGEWWTEGAWKELVLPPMVLELLAPLRRLILAIEVELKAQTQAISAAAPEELPLGLGKLTYEILEREVCDWDRFHNRREVASYTGMCPSEDSSDERRFQGPINKHGNPRVRSVLVETSWRLMQFQPEYKPVAKWLPVLKHPKTTKSKRKQIAVAIGRQFSVDWWRVRTGRCQAQDLGLKLKPAPQAVAATLRAKSSSAKPGQKP
jgi:transposase